MEFVFEEKAWELKLAGMKAGDSLDAAAMLTLLQGQDEEEVEAALEAMEARRITLHADRLPAENGSGELSVRLKRVKELVDKGTLLQSLEENDPLRMYLEEVAGIPAAGDPQLLAQRFADGEEAAGEMLVNLMLSQVVSQAMAQAGKGVLLLDLIQEGSLGLWQSIVSYEGGDFEQQSRWWIAQYQAKALLRQALANGTGEKLRQALEAYRKADRELLTKLGRNPLPVEIAEVLNISGEDAAFLEKMLLDARQQQRIRPEDKQEQEPEEEDQSAENTAYYQSRQRIRDMLSGLEGEDAELISLRYGLEGGVPMDPAQVGRKLGLTPEEVVKREAAALQKLRQQTES